ncbi:MAG: hypothetical protein PHO94_10440 [Petrimonas sp.]|nr:hypothetical protein [Petrimonas sp.]
MKNNILKKRMFTVLFKGEHPFRAPHAVLRKIQKITYHSFSVTGRTRLAVKLVRLPAETASRVRKTDV